MNNIERVTGVIPERDLAGLMELYAEAGWWSDGEKGYPLLKKIISGSHAFVVARNSRGQIIAMGRAISDGASDAYLQDVTTHPDYRGKGLARQIIRALIEILAKDGMGWIGVVAERGSYGLYEKLNFSQMPDSRALLLNR